MKKKPGTPGEAVGAADDFTSDLIKSLNKEHGSRIAYNLASDESPTHVKRWISTGSTLLDYIVSNRRDGGLPEGRIVEIFGPPSIGKSHIALQICKSTQRMGGIVVYIDTENGTSVENLKLLGVDVNKGFVYVDTHCTEEVFEVAEKTIMKAKAMAKDVPITIIWDSVAASSPKAELLGEYDKETVGLQARAISKGMRKITGIIGDQSILFVILNQIRSKIGVMHGDPTTTPGGMAIPFHASVRIKLSSGMPIKNKADEVIGINVIAKTIKNKVAAPFRNANFEIHFGKGIIEHEHLFDVLREAGEKTVGDNIICVSGDGAWKVFTVTDSKQGKVILEKKFYKADFGELLSSPTYSPYLQDLIEATMVKKMGEVVESDIDTDSYEEVRSALMDIAEGDLS
jgi:recombination protein RecA